MPDEQEPDEALCGAFVDAASALQGLPVRAEHRPGVIRNMMLIARMARLVAEHPLEPGDEAAPVFHPSGGGR